MSSRRWAAPVVLAASAAVLAGCLTVPHAGGVQVNAPTSSGPAVKLDEDVRINPAGPLPDAKPADVVAGFYDAMIDRSADYAVAKEFLVNGAWKSVPTAVDIMQNKPQIFPDGSPTAFKVTYQKVAEVQSDGQFVVAGDGLSPVTERIELVKDTAGQYRVANPPQSLRLSIRDFGLVFHEATTFYPRGDSGQLVPDRHLFLASPSELPDSIARAYAAGPSKALSDEPTVTALLPAGTAGSATGGVSAPSLTFTTPGNSHLSNAAHDLLIDALRHTFAGFADLTEFSVSIAGAQPEKVQLAKQTDTPLALADAWAVDTAGKLLRPWSALPLPAESTDKQFDVAGMTRVSLSPRMDFAAGITKGFNNGLFDLRLRDRNGLAHDVTLGAARLTTPAWTADKTGLWLAGEVNHVQRAWFVHVPVLGSGSSATYPEPSLVEVALDPLLTSGGGAIVDLRPSPDGVRISAVVRRHAGKDDASELYVGRISGIDGYAPSIVSIHPIAPVLTPLQGNDAALFDVSQVAWIDTERLMVIAQAGTEQYKLWSATYDGEVVDPIDTSGLPLDPPMPLAAGVNTLPLALDKKDNVWMLTGQKWVRQGTTKGPLASAIMYPG